MLPGRLDPLALTALALVVAVLALLLGLRLSRAPTPWWAAAWAAALLAILTLGVTRRFAELAFVAPFSWIGAGRGQFLVFSAAATLVLSILAPRLPHPRQRRTVLAFLGLCVSVFGLGPLLLPALLRDRHEGLPTRLDANGVCIQGDGYTCGPAAAVTALRWLGLEATVGDIAVRALTTPLTGTPPDLLCDALHGAYAAQGLACEYRVFQSVPEIPPDGVTIIAVKLSFLIDHYLAVKEVTATEVVAGDPLVGLVKFSHAELERRWRRTGIVLTRGSRSR